MARRDRQVMEEVLVLLHSCGAVVSQSGRTRGGHQVVRWSLDGVAQVTFFPSTTSDKRSTANTLAMVRRQIRHLGGDA